MNTAAKIETQDLLKRDFDVLRAAYQAKPAPTHAERVEVLKRLKASVIKHEKAIYEAVIQDYGYRSEFDSLMTDILPTVMGIKYALKNLKKWMKPSKRHAGLMLFPSKVRVHYQPLGVVGVITPWNFPFFLALGPATQALAAGNRVMIKMSEFTPAANKVMRSIAEDLAEHMVIVEGEAEVGAAFSALPFDHLIFTGSTGVARHVARAAADNLTPITLELGGKSPTIVDDKVSMDIAVDAVMVGKSINSGQICVAPDYVFVPAAREQEFIETFIKRYRDYHLNGKNKNSQTQIINERQYNRLMGFLKDAQDKGAKVHSVKAIEEGDGKLVYPQLLTNVNQDMSVLQEEIFGSILPVMTYNSVADVIQYINDRPRPLALYVMSSDDQFIEQILENTHSGGVSINDSVMHVAADDAPFGGIGNSGMGHYHGHEGFLTFSKARTVLYSKSWLPKNHFVLKHRDLVFKTLRSMLLK